MMRTIRRAIIHCSATREGQKVTIESIRAGHKKRGFRDIGYHFIVDTDGVLFTGRPIELAGAHASGYNSDSIGICYIGGLDKDGHPADTRTFAQIKTIDKLLKEICDAYPIEEIKGHRDYSPDKDGDGKIERWEWIKVCPCYNAEIEHKHLLS